MEPAQITARWKVKGYFKQCNLPNVNPAISRIYFLISKHLIFFNQLMDRQAYKLAAIPFLKKECIVEVAWNQLCQMLSTFTLTK